MPIHRLLRRSST